MAPTPHAAPAAAPPGGSGGHASTQLCEVCYQAAATLVCCSDEAALCDACDARRVGVHTANGISVKHVRLAFTGPSHGKAPQRTGSHARDTGLTDQASRPPCDVCQQARALIHCRQERSYLCQSCDQSVHTASSVAAAHARFYLALVQVALLPIPDVAFTGRAAALRARQAAAEAAAAAAQVAKEQRSLNRMRAAQGNAISGGTAGAMTAGALRQQQPRAHAGKGADANGDEEHEDQSSDAMLPGCGGGGGAPPSDGQLLRGDGNGSGQFGGGPEGVEYDTAGTAGAGGARMGMGRIFSFSDLVLPSDVLDNSMGGAAMEV